MKRTFLLTIITLTLILAACSGKTATPAAVSQTTEIEIIATTLPEPTGPHPRDTATSISLSTSMPTTNTPAPEPATATSIPTVEISAEGEATATETAASLTETGEAEVAPPTPAEENSPTAESPTETSTTATPDNSVPPPAAGDVPAPNDANYPDNSDKASWENRITVPAGFEVDYVGRIDGNPTSITFGPDGLLYIAAMNGNIHTMDDNGNVGLHASGFNIPTGLAFRPGTNDLYVSDRVLNENVNGEAQVSIVGRGQLFGGLPCCYTNMHSANGIAFGLDGMGYVGVGGRADHGEILDGSGRQDEMHPNEASILRFNPDSGEVTNYARGFRNPYDIVWDANNQLWATDNTPDFDPPERLHKVVSGGEHGYPWYDCDVCFSPPADVNIIPPLVTFARSSSPTGIAVYLANQFPGYYNSMFVTLWSAFYGAQKVMHIGPGGSVPTNFATGFAAPIDVTVGPDGSLYVADWATGIIFKISYTG
ncbi:MAG: hypothetical protein GY796_31060 [Chloroflexi bacterium]|nr:hypothetical protein [Chloroflexota bacterium]